VHGGPAAQLLSISQEERLQQATSTGQEIQAASIMCA
jgi:hypothetical protein